MRETSIEDLINKANEKGFLINNLFQIYDSSWQANLRAKDDSVYTVFGRGKTPHRAMKEAIRHISTGGSKRTKRSRKRLANIQPPILTTKRRKRKRLPRN